MESISKEEASIGVTVPRVIKFGYERFSVKGEKWSAYCTKCQKMIQDQKKVTSAFTK